MWAEDSARAIALCGVLVKPKPNSTDPQPIDVDHLHALYQHADVQLRAALLVMLNAAMYGSEAVALNWSDVNLDKGTLVTNRPKTGEVRIAVLWPETIVALRELGRTDAAAIFISATRVRHLPEPL
jgi:integrase